jgi:hypothetical protein
VPPVERPIPKFVAEPPHELEPYGRWAEQLGKRFLDACAAVEGVDTLGAPGLPTWFPERTYAGRSYVPATASVEGGGELFGYVSFTRDERSSDPGDFIARADYTADTAAEHPDWQLDLNDEVIGSWRGPGGTEGEMTLIWGAPQTPGGAAVTAELEAETLDQCALVQSERFTLVALDAVRGYGDDLYLEVRLWSKRGVLLAFETLYAEEE